MIVLKHITVRTLQSKSFSKIFRQDQVKDFAYAKHHAGKKVKALYTRHRHSLVSSPGRPVPECKMAEIASCFRKSSYEMIIVLCPETR